MRSTSFLRVYIHMNNQAGSFLVTLNVLLKLKCPENVGMPSMRHDPKEVTMSKTRVVKNFFITKPEICNFVVYLNPITGRGGGQFEPHPSA